MIKAIFFATFDIDEGPKLHHLLPQPVPGTPPLLDFKPVAPYLIPPPDLCNTPLTLLSPSPHHSQPAHRILSHPVCIKSEDYPRNAFTFNFGLVLDAETEFSSYLPVVKKLATLFRGLEEQGRFLSKDLAASANVFFTADVGDGINSGDDDVARESVSSGRRVNSKIYALSEILLEDLNNYGETQIPLDDANTLNLKLFPTYPPPPPLYAWHVPLATVPLDTLLESTTGGSGGGDLTMSRVLPYIDGVNSVKRISLLADADFKLVRKAVRHLLYYGCCILLDIFSFSAIYAPTSTISIFVEDADMQEECAKYVALPFPATVVGSSSSAERRDGQETDRASGPSGMELAQAYLSLRQGLSVKSWCMERPSLADQIDIRRFITFGVIKGFLYRVHRYAIAASTITTRKGAAKSKSKKAGKDAGTEESDGPGAKGDQQLQRFLDGTHCFDEICTELGISERDLLGRLKAQGAEVQIICR